MRTLFCSLLLVAALIVAPASLAWNVPVAKAPLTVWEEVVEAWAGWLAGPIDLGPTTDPDGVSAARDPEGASATYGQENDPGGDIGPAVDPEG